MPDDMVLPTVMITATWASEARVLVQGLTRQDRPDDEAQRELDKTIRTIKPISQAAIGKSV